MMPIGPQLSIILASWPSNFVFHLRNRLYICLIGIASPKYLINRTNVEGFSHNSDISATPLEWPKSLAECLIPTLGVFNVFYDLEKIMGYTWPE
jgi:hypothetical protein